MNECFGEKFILNGELHPAEMFNNSLIYEGDSVYEVIRMVGLSPVFFKDHMERLDSSVKIQKRHLLADRSEIRRCIIDLTRSDRNKDVNLKIVFNYNDASENFLIYFIEPIIPSTVQFKKGVKGILFFGERQNPESKVINHKLRSSIFHKLILEGGYEALLVNPDNLITEGSRSNIFFLKGERLVTAPDKVVLNGITRKYLLDICRMNSIDVELRCVRVDEMSEYDTVFMTGTSPTILPFCCIENNHFNVKAPIMEKLRQSYLLKVDESIRSFRNP